VWREKWRTRKTRWTSSKSWGGRLFGEGSHEHFSPEQAHDSVAYVDNIDSEKMSESSAII